MANILIADPNPGIRELISQSLHGLPHQLIFAEDSAKAQDAFQKNPIHLLITDEDLPGADPLEFLKEIKKHHPQTAVIIMTNAGEEESEELLDAGAQTTLSKPFNLEDFKRIVAEAIPPHPLSLPPCPTDGRREGERVKRSEGEGKRSGQKLFWGVGGLAFLAFFIAGFFWYFKIWSQPIRIYSLPASHISAVAHAGQFLWTCDWFNQTFYQHNLDAILSVKQSFSLSAAGKGGTNEDYVPTGITWDGKNLWSVSSWTKKVVRHDANFQKFELELESPVKEPSAIYFDGNSFWFCDASEGKIVRCILEGKKLKITESAPSPAQKPAGIYKDPKNLWSFDARSELIYKHHPEKNFRVIAVYSLPEHLQKEKISCFTSDGQNFWIGSESSQKILQLPLRHLKLVSKSD